MDIRCTTCGEPWDADELHEVELYDMTTPTLQAAHKLLGRPQVKGNPGWDVARWLFERFGCGVFGQTCEGRNADAAARVVRVAR